ncbi:hypothetical protein KSP40_PGU013909 [Platanthera guangdongensis]|uniref:Uncharacterized protein n=1 Tax=Platanthera guangdongensis TaxID=2320717 RepID=A0ABR2N2G1_9ASPA
MALLPQPNALLYGSYGRDNDHYSQKRCVACRRVGEDQIDALFWSRAASDARFQLGSEQVCRKAEGEEEI